MKNTMSYTNYNSSVKCFVLVCTFNAKTKLFLPFCGIILFMITLAGKHKLILASDALFILQPHLTSHWCVLSGYLILGLALLYPQLYSFHFSLVTDQESLQKAKHTVPE